MNVAMQVRECLSNGSRLATVCGTTARQPIATKLCIGIKAMEPATFIAARRKLGLTQEQLAELLDVSTRQVQRWESGASKISGPVNYAIKAMLDRHD